MDYICKNLPIEVAKSSISNHQIWMKKPGACLMMSEEKKVIPELFEDSVMDSLWLDKEDIDFSETLTKLLHVSCFSKSINNSICKTVYGEMFVWI